MNALQLAVEEPTRRTGNRFKWKEGTHSYLLLSETRPNSGEEEHLISAAMEWAFRLLPHGARVCDAYLLSSNIGSYAEHLGVRVFPTAANGMSLLAPDSQKLAELLCDHALHDDDMFVRPMAEAIVPDIQPWLSRDQSQYAAHGPERYGAVLMFALRPISFEILSSVPLENVIHRTRSLMNEFDVSLDVAPTPPDRNWPGWIAWFKSQLHL